MKWASFSFSFGGGLLCGVEARLQTKLQGGAVFKWAGLYTTKHGSLHMATTGDSKNSKSYMTESKQHFGVVLDEGMTLSHDRKLKTVSFV